MKKTVTAIFLYTLLLFAGIPWHIALAGIPPRPSPPRLVNDFAGMLSVEEENILEQKLVAYDDSTSTQIVIVTVNNLDGDEVAQYAYTLGDAWGVGRKQKDNGVIILLAKESHDVTIATGRGMEGVLPDAICRRLIDNIMIPEFRNNQFYNGLNLATDAIIKLAAGEFVNDVTNETKGPSFVLVMVLVFIAIIIISSIIRRNGGDGGSIGGKGFNPLGPVWWGGSIGRSSGSGSFGGGGFGGFGGGGFGGGGASGKW